MGEVGAGRARGQAESQREVRTIRTARLQGQDDRESQDMEERSFQFAVAVVRLGTELSDHAPRKLLDRIVGLGTDLGADVAEAFASHSRRTYLSRLESARRISREMGYWLKLLIGAELAGADTVRPFLDEAHALHTILTTLCSRVRQEVESD